MVEDSEKYIQQIQQESDIFSKAKLISFLVRDKNIRVIDLARSLSKTPSYICHLIRLASLPDMIVDGYYSNLISISHLFVISRIKDQKKLLEIYEQLLKHSYTVFQTEDLIREVLYSINNNGKRLAKDELEDLIQKIKEKNKDIQIKAIQTRIKGKMVVEVKGNLENTSQALRNLLKRLV
ncbi:hypothetical protein HY041_02600 [Candidatus Roizmanbacteria bacterium]|nr:hypothetical protein [Candidatus Roizmanbacteria bacterium]